MSLKNDGLGLLKSRDEAAFEQFIRCLLYTSITHNSALTAMADRVIRIKNGMVAEMSLNATPMDISLIEW